MYVWKGFIETFAQFVELVTDVLVFESKFIDRFRKILFYGAQFRSQAAAFRVSGFLKFFALTRDQTLQLLLWVFLSESFDEQQNDSTERGHLPVHCCSRSDKRTVTGG